jgi:hypothetical protein
LFCRASNPIFGVGKVPRRRARSDRDAAAALAFSPELFSPPRRQKKRHREMRLPSSSTGTRRRTTAVVMTSPIVTDAIHKPERDARLYRRVTFPNGLEACLISDPSLVRRVASSDPPRSVRSPFQPST